MPYAFGASFAAGAFWHGRGTVILLYVWHRAEHHRRGGVGRLRAARRTDSASRNVVLVSLAALVLLGGVLLLVEFGW